MKRHPAEPDHHWLGRGVCFEPVTLTTAVAYGAVALAAVGAGVAAYSAVQQGDAAADAANHNSQLAAQQALIAQQQAEQDAQTQQRQARQRIGAASAAYGASGVSGDGSPLDVLSTSASQAELDRQNILYKGKLKSLGYQDQSQLDTAAAGQAQAGGALKAGSAVLTGASNAAGKLGSGGGAGNSPSLSANEIGTLNSTSPGDI